MRRINKIQSTLSFPPFLFNHNIFHKKLLKLLCLLLLGILVFSNSPCALATAYPIWFREGVFVEYAFETYSIDFLNGTFLILDGKGEGFFRWECIKLEGDLATINVSIILSAKNLLINWSTTLYVNVTSRYTSLPNGTRIGVTRLWLPSNPNIGNEILLVDINQDEISGEITEIGSGQVATPQGGQKYFSIFGEGVVLGHNVTLMDSYDLDTGVLIEGWLEAEPATVVMGVWGEFLMRIHDTNINLGPRELWPEILRFIIFTAPLVFFVLIFILVYRQRSKRRSRNIPQRENRKYLARACFFGRTVGQ